MPDQPDNYEPNLGLEPSDAELEMVVDEARHATGQGPAARSAMQGITAMQARLKLLTEQKNKLLDQMDDNPTDTQLGNELSTLNKELREAQSRLAGYHSQFEGLN